MPLLLRKGTGQQLRLYCHAVAQKFWQTQPGSLRRTCIRMCHTSPWDPCRVGVLLQREWEEAGIYSSSSSSSPPPPPPPALDLKTTFQVQRLLLQTSMCALWMQDGKEGAATAAALKNGLIGWQTAQKGARLCDARAQSE